MTGPISDFIRPGATVRHDGERLEVVAYSLEPVVLVQDARGARSLVTPGLLEPVPTTAADILDEYGQALRGAWGNIDGRTERARLADLSALIRTRGGDPLDDDQIMRIRDGLDVCPTGGGHWTEFCDATCNPVVAANERDRA